uniref:Transcription factor AP-1 n=1 Tax=Scolopendra viridis TaxID=118503 RepID=A0A4D5RA29_SCOVI
METTFYDDQTFSSKESIKNLKKKLTLDFNAARPQKKEKVSTLLSSPDLNMLKLASPELEKLIIQQNGVVTTTPTPTQFIFPKNVTEEQEMYARGFVDALAELHNSNSSLSDIVTSATGTSTSSYSALPANSATTSTLPIPSLAAAPVSISSIFTTSAFPPSSTSALIPIQIKEEPQTVPNLGATPPLSPIDMETQEKIKLERKRQRNRIAASKCRKRKLERIARLEDKVKMLKGENGELGNVVSKLREQVCQLKQQVMDHMNNGCQIMLSQQQF